MLKIKSDTELTESGLLAQLEQSNFSTYQECFNLLKNQKDIDIIEARVEELLTNMTLTITA